MKRRTLDLLFSAGGVLFSVLLLILGLVLNSQADFAKDYVKDQLTEQQISFPAEYGRGETDVAGSDCLTKYAGKPLTNGKMSECYANFFIKTHMGLSTEAAGVPGATYATLGGDVNDAKAAVKAAEEAGTDTTELQARVDELSGLRDTMFKGETLRGLLLTTYGFSIFGDRASTAAAVCFAGFALLLLLSLAGFVHAFVTPKEKKVHVPGTE